MPRENFDKKLQGLIDQILVLGSMVEEALTQSVQDLKPRTSRPLDVWWSTIV
jgi:hypothetical protein